MRFIGHYKLSCFITYLSIVFGVLGMIYAIKGNIDYALICLIASGIADMFDGKVARHEKRDTKEREYGVQLDSLADSFNYTALPITIGLCLGYDDTASIITYLFLACAGVIRLAYFNVYTSDSDKAIKTYTGLPITSIAFILPLLWLFRKILISKFQMVFTLVIFITALFYILDIKIPKATNKLFYIIMSILGVLGAVLLICL